MAVVGTEWVIVGAIIIIIFIWGPNKIPELARSIGRAKREFDEARNAIKDEEEEKAKGL